MPYNYNHKKSDRDNALTPSTTDNAVAYQILKNAAQGRTDNLMDTMLPKNREILRGYSVTSRDPFTNAPASIRIWDLFVDIHEIDKRLEKFFEEQYRDASILVFDPADNDRVYRLKRENEYQGNHVFTLAGLYYQDVEHLKPGLLKALDPKTQPEFGTPVTLVGEISNDQKPPISAMLRQANISMANVHPRPDEMPDNRFCSAYNCPVCNQVFYTLDRFVKEGYLSGRLYLGESFLSERNRTSDELGYLSDTLEALTTSTQLMALMSDSAQIMTASIKTVERMRDNYARMLKAFD